MSPIPSLVCIIMIIIHTASLPHLTCVSRSILANASHEARIWMHDADDFWFLIISLCCIFSLPVFSFQRAAHASCLENVRQMKNWGVGTGDWGWGVGVWECCCACCFARVTWPLHRGCGLRWFTQERQTQVARAKRLLTPTKKIENTENTENTLYLVAIESIYYIFISIQHIHIFK